MEATLYTDLYATPPAQVVVHAIVPGLDGQGNIACPGTATNFGVARYFDAVESTQGLSFDIYDAGCGPSDIGAALSSIADHVQ